MKAAFRQRKARGFAACLKAHEAGEKIMMHLEQEIVRWGIKAKIHQTAREECGKRHWVQGMMLFSVLIFIHVH